MVNAFGLLGLGQRVSPLAVLLTEKQHEQQQAGPQLLVERLRNDAISNYVATSALEQRFLNQWLENIGPHPLQESKGAA